MGIVLFVGFLFMSSRLTMAVVSAFCFLLSVFNGYVTVIPTARELGIRAPSSADIWFGAFLGVAAVFLAARAVRWGYFRAVKNEVVPFI